MANTFKPGDKAVWWNGPGHQSRAEVTVTEVDGDEVTFETPSYMYGRYETVWASELKPLPESVPTEEPPMTTSDPAPDDHGDDEEFCSRCLAGVDSSEHHEKCVVTGFAEDGESAPTPDPRETEHIECDCVPDLGPSHCHLCGERAGHPVPWSEAHPDGKPGDHDELLAKAEWPGDLTKDELIVVIREFATALRTEQSARQAAEARIDAIREWNTLSNGRARYRELDRLVNPEAWVDPDAEPTLDPEPIGTGYNEDGEIVRVPYYEPMNPLHRFLPRSEYSQNPADYGIEAPHE